MKLTQPLPNGYLFGIKMDLTLFNISLAFVDWTKMRQGTDGKEHAKAVRSRASKQGAKTKRIKQQLKIK